MKNQLRVLIGATIAVVLMGCALLQPLGVDDEARSASKITLAAYMATQDAMLIYGRLKPCDPALVVVVCRNAGVWRKMQIADKAAVTAIVAAAPVLNGTKVDAGEVLAAMLAIERVRAAVREAQQSLAAPAT